MITFLSFVVGDSFQPRPATESVLGDPRVVDPCQLIEPALFADPPGGTADGAHQLLGVVDPGHRPLVQVVLRDLGR